MQAAWGTCARLPATSTSGCLSDRLRGSFEDHRMSLLVLNERALRVAEQMIDEAAALRIAVRRTSAGARILDCGVGTEGGLQAGAALARVCLSDLGEVSLVSGDVG